MYVDRVPKHVDKRMLPSLKVGTLIKTRNPDESQDKDFTTKFLPAGSVGRIKKIFDFGSKQKSNRFLCDVKFEGHPITNFYTEELVKVKI